MLASMGGVSDELDRDEKETFSKYELDGLLEKVDALNKQPVNIAVITTSIYQHHHSIEYP